MSRPRVRRDDTMEVVRKRFYEVLDYDPSLSASQLAERFSIGLGTASTWKREWNQEKGKKHKK